MLIIPAIDIKDGKVVRLCQGKFENKKVYSRDPAKIARQWQEAGAKLIHIVDLDGAATGKPKNLPAVKKILKSISVPVELGGGIRNIGVIDSLVKAGVSRVILGTSAVEDRGFLKKALAKFRNKIIVSVDAKGTTILTKGWLESFTGFSLLDFALDLKKMGVKQLIYTDVSKDGMLKGPNLRAISNLLEKTGIEVIASGGVSSLGDLIRLKALEKKGLAGVIVGKALYEGKFTLVEAINKIN
jgi:phosphoribosylformimino-5-aminoimidazole carboxamide ribotide isomerase